MSSEINNFDDLSDLKKGWSVLRTSSRNEMTSNKEQLSQMLGKKSKHINYRFKRMLWLEASLCVLFALFFGVLMYEADLVLKVLWGIIFVIYLVGLFWLSYQAFHFPTQSYVDMDLQKLLDRQIEVAKRFIRLYVDANVILAVPCTIIGFLVGISLHKEGGLTSYLQEIVTTQNYLKALFLSVIALISSFLVRLLLQKYLHWFVNKTYGKYVQEIEQLKNQLER